MSGGRTRIVAVVVAALVSVLVPGTAEAGSGGLRLRLSASEGLRAGQVVDYTVTGPALQPERFVSIAQCDADVMLEVGDLEDLDLDRWCTTGSSHWVPEGATSLQGQLTIREVFTTYPQGSPVDVHCGDERRDCAIVAITFGGDPIDRVEAVDRVRIDVIPSPLAVGGLGLLFGGGTVQVWVSGEPGATVTLAQCVRYPGVPRDLDDCREGPILVLSRSGRAATEMPVVPSLEVDGRTYECIRRPCQITSFDSSGAILGAAGVPGSVPYAEITLDRSTGLRHGDVIHARIASTAEVVLYVGICLASVADDTISSGDGCYVYFPLVGPGVHDYELVVYERFVPFNGGPEVACSDDPGGCIIGVGSVSSSAGYVPISFASPPPP